MNGSSHYDPRNPGQYPSPPNQLPPKKTMPWWAWLLVGVFGVPALLIGGCTAILGGSLAAETAKDDPTPVISTQTPEVPVETYDPGIQTPPTTEAPKPKPTKPTATKPAMTASQEQAIGSAESYLAYTAFSRKGLIRQLSSDAGEGFSVADATYAVDHIKVDWNEQAAKKAREYLAMTHFSRSGLIRQLESDAGEGFTHRQAVYGVTKAGL
jgi:hypothetical protein